MNHNKLTHATLVAAVSLALSGCATPVKYTSGPTAQHDKNTKYTVDDRSDGFTLNVYYSRYQFVPESGAVADACRSQATALA